MAFVDDFFLPLKATSIGLPFILFLRTLPASRALPFRGVGVGCEEPHLSIYLRLIQYTAHQIDGLL